MLLVGPTYKSAIQNVRYISISDVRTNYSPNKLEKQGSQNCFFPNGVWHAVWKKTILSDLFCACILVRLRVYFVRYISRTFPIYISDKLWSK